MHYQKENEEIDIYKFLNKLNWHLSIHLKIRPEKNPFCSFYQQKKKKRPYICNKGILLMDQELIRYSILIAAHKKRSKNEVCVYR